jgi:hypothetical protein
MNTKEYVKLSSDSKFITVKYMVMEASVGAAASSTYLWLKVASYGIDTDAHYKDYMDSIADDSFSRKDLVTDFGFQGTLDAYSVVALDAVEAYGDSKKLTLNIRHYDGPHPIG